MFAVITTTKSPHISATVRRAGVARGTPSRGREELRACRDALARPKRLKTLNVYYAPMPAPQPRRPRERQLRAIMKNGSTSTTSSHWDAGLALLLSLAAATNVSQLANLSVSIVHLYVAETAHSP